MRTKTSDTDPSLILALFIQVSFVYEIIVWFLVIKFNVKNKNVGRIIIFLKTFYVI